MFCLDSKFFLPESAFYHKSIQKDTSTFKESDLSQAIPIHKKDVLKIANHHVQHYLKEDSQTKGRHIRVINNWVDLYDLDNNLFAYMVPLEEKGKGEIGYITVGAIQDGYDAYEIYIDSHVVSHLRSKQMEKRKGGKKAQIIFIPPMQYVIEVTENEMKQYFHSSSYNGKTVDVTDSVKNNQSQLRKSYCTIRNNENKIKIQSILNNDSTGGLSFENHGATAVVSSENVKLQRESEGQFVPVYNLPQCRDGSTVSYGGNQMWWPNGSAEKSRGCGPVAAANIFNYFAGKDCSLYGKLYSSISMSYMEWMNHQNIVYACMNPPWYGMTNLGRFVSNVEQFARNRGVTLTRVTSSDSFTLDNTAQYIKNGLQNDSPVATLNLQKWGYAGSGMQYGWHWMAITKYFRSMYDDRWIAVSTWGERHSINYRTHFHAMYNYGGGIIYFK